MRNLITLVLSLAALAVPCGRAAAQTGAPVPAVPAAAPQGQVTLQPGDLIRVQIYREEDLNGEFPVDEAGVVVLPLIGERSVAGIPVRELREQLVEAYRVHLRNPSISITPLRRVNVLGEVQRPGLYPIDPTISLAGAIALAGGANTIGDLRKIRIVRRGVQIRERVGTGETISDADIRSGDEIIVERRSWFDRNSTVVVSSVISVTSLVIALATR
jgi:polysaccharide export outer membrane protein